MTAQVDFEMTVGEDWTAQAYFLDEYDNPQPLVPFPARMDIQDQIGGTVFSLQASADLDPQELPSLVVSPASGVVQMHIPRTISDNFNPNAYRYDLWLTYSDDGLYAGTQVAPALRGKFIVNDRVTETF